MLENRNHELVSVIIPTYRGDRFIADSLAAVAGQTWRHWELIVVEDGSNGETEAIARRFAAQHPEHRIEYLRHEQNNSQSAARNTALKHVRGEYVAFLDVDDLWQPTHLAASLAALQTNRDDLAYSTVAMFDDDTDIVFGVWGPTYKNLREFPYSLFDRNFVTPSSVVVRRGLIERVGKFDTTLCPCEDVDYWIRCAAAGGRFTHIKGCHVLYRKNHSEAETRGISRLTEAYARVVDRHLSTLPPGKRNVKKRAAELYFGAAWCHATLKPERDPTAVAWRTPDLLKRARELHHGRVSYRLHALLTGWLERCRCTTLLDWYYRCFRPKKFVLLGSPSAGSAAAAGAKKRAA